MWILETIMWLSTELQKGIFCFLMVGEEKGSHIFVQPQRVTAWPWDQDEWPQY